MVYIMYSCMHIHTYIVHMYILYVHIYLCTYYVSFGLQSIISLLLCKHAVCTHVRLYISSDVNSLVSEENQVHSPANTVRINSNREEAD